jgi:secondary thiamine-phosphate synthase enzyme
MISIAVQSEQKEQVMNVTEEVQRAIEGSRMAFGFAIVSIPHTTACLFLSEDDPELRDDLVRAATELLSDLRPFTHRRNNNPNAEAHIMSSLLGSRLLIPVEEHKVRLGTYQNIFFLELDGPKKRTIEIFLYAAGAEATRRSDTR